MFDFNLTRESGTTVLHVHGELVGDDDADILNETFAFVQPDDHLVLDLTAVNELDSRSAALIRATLMRRAVMAETVVVSTRERVSMQLVLHDVDRISPIVRSTHEAQQILSNSWANRRQSH